MLRFHFPLIEPDVRISRIRLSDKASIGRLGEQMLDCNAVCDSWELQGVFWGPVSIPSPLVALP